MSEKTKELFTSRLKVINVGADHFAESLRRQGIGVEQVDWRPPAGGDKEMEEMLKKMGI
jgi:FdrA protein